MLQADNFSIDNRLFKEYIDVARANRAIEIEKKRAIETEECRAREAIRLQMVQVERENILKQQVKKQMVHPVFCLEV